MTIPKTKAEMLKQLEDKMIEVLAILESHYKKELPIPTINIKPALGRKMGFARYRDNSVTLNQDVCTETHWHEMLDNTLGHEVCHLVARVIYNRWHHGYDKHSGWGHGRAWKECMVVIGLPPERCYDDKELGDSIAVRKVARKYSYKCNCPTPHTLTSILHNRIQSGNNRTCRKCKARIVYQGQLMNA